MMIERDILTKNQRNVEQDALFPTAREHELTTDDIVIRGEDSADVEQLGTNQDDHEILTQSIYESHVTEFHQLLDFRVKNEIVTQLFKSHNDPSVPHGAVNISDIASVIAKETQAELDHHFMQATYLENDAIPSARLRPHFEEKFAGNPSAYLSKDIPVLESREDAHIAMVQYISDFQPTSDDAAHELAEAEAKRMMPEARDEVVKILRELKGSLERQKLEAVEKITELEATIEDLTHELADRDMQLLDREFTAHLTEVAKNLAVK